VTACNCIDQWSRRVDEVVVRMELLLAQLLKPASISGSIPYKASPGGRGRPRPKSQPVLLCVLPAPRVRDVLTGQSGCAYVHHSGLDSKARFTCRHSRFHPSPRPPPRQGPPPSRLQQSLCVHVQLSFQGVFPSAVQCGGACLHRG
jgi:hypothetical protein